MTNNIGLLFLGGRGESFSLPWMVDDVNERVHGSMSVWEFMDEKR